MKVVSIGRVRALTCDSFHRYRLAIRYVVGEQSEKGNFTGRGKEMPRVFPNKMEAYTFVGGIKRTGSSVTV